jgi:hypothetical protein
VKLKLGLIDNACDSLNEALRKYKQGADGNVVAHKYVVVHLAHFAELILKGFVNSINEYLVYEKCFECLMKEVNSREVSIESVYDALMEEGVDFDELAEKNGRKTIRTSKAVSFVKSRNGADKDCADFLEKIDYIKDIRNDVLHFEVNMSVFDVRRNAGVLIKSATNFCNNENLVDIRARIDRDLLSIFDNFFNEEEFWLDENEVEANYIIRDINKGLSRKDCAEGIGVASSYECDVCSRYTMIPDGNSWTKYSCRGCGEKTSSTLEIPCAVCGCPVQMWHMTAIKTDSGDEWVCENCYRV